MNVMWMEPDARLLIKTRGGGAAGLSVTQCRVPVPGLYAGSHLVAGKPTCCSD